MCYSWDFGGGIFRYEIMCFEAIDDLVEEKSLTKNMFLEQTRKYHGRDIAGYIEVMGKPPKLGASNFFIERTYKQAGTGSHSVAEHFGEGA